MNTNAVRATNKNTTAIGIIIIIIIIMSVEGEE
jgi:hypothetical protein